jgi:hypothetical protein
MGIIAVQDFRRKEETDNIDDLLGKVGKGLQIAQAVYGFKTAGEQSDLRALQMEREKQVIEAGKLGIEKTQRESYLSKQGIMERNKFNNEYFSITSDKVDDFIKKWDYPLQAVNIRIEDPESPKGYKEITAVDKDDLKAAQKAAMEAKQFEQRTQLENKKADKEVKPKPSAGAFEAAGFADRINIANQNFQDLEKMGFDRAEMGTALMSTLTRNIGEVGDYFKSEELKLWDQAARNFINAVLRRESGAAIAESEFQNAEAQYFPVAGDTEAVKAQKRRNREVVQAALEREATYGLTGEILPIIRNATSAISGQSVPMSKTIIPTTGASMQQRSTETDEEFLNRYTK